MTLAGWLEKNGAAKDVVDWARPYGEDGAKAWTECPRGDWLLAIAVRAKVDPRSVVAAAAGCARFALDYVPRGEARPLAAIEVAERWSRGEASDRDCARAAAGAEEAANDSLDPVGSAAALAAYSAVRGAVDPTEAVFAPTAACEAATLAAAECAALSAYRYTADKTAGAVRAAIEWSAVAPGIVETRPSRPSRPTGSGGG